MEHGDAHPDEMMSGGWRIFTCNLKHAHIVTIKMRQIMCNSFHVILVVCGLCVYNETSIKGFVWIYKYIMCNAG